MPTCPQCGSKSKKGHAFCESCGAPAESGHKTSPGREDNLGSARFPRISRKTVVWIIAGVLAVLVVTAAVLIPLLLLREGPTDLREALKKELPFEKYLEVSMLPNTNKKTDGSEKLCSYFGESHWAILLNKDGTYEMITEAMGKEDGTYKVSGNKVTMKCSNGEDWTFTAKPYIFKDSNGDKVFTYSLLGTGSLGSEMGVRGPGSEWEQEQ